MARTAVEIEASEGTCPAFVFRPAGEGAWPAVIMYMDGIGMRPALHTMAARVSDHGY